MQISGCPSWLSETEFLRCRSDAYRTLETAQRHMDEVRANIKSLRASNSAAESHPLLQVVCAMQNFEKFRVEHLALEEVCNELQQQRTTLLDVVEVLREEKRALLLEIHEARQRVLQQELENSLVLAECRRQEGKRRSSASQLMAQESQLAALGEQERLSQERLATLRAECNALLTAVEQASLQAASLSKLRSHLEETRTAQTAAVEALQDDVTKREAALQEAAADVWDYRAEMSGRVLALQRVAQEREDALQRVRRRSENAMDALAVQNVALGKELKRTAQALVHSRGEFSASSAATKQAIVDQNLAVQKYTGIVQLVQEQNEGLRGAIARMEKQLQQSTSHITEKDTVNHRTVTDQVNMVFKVHMELHATQEDMRLATAQLCSSCHQRLSVGQREVVVSLRDAHNEVASCIEVTSTSPVDKVREKEEELNCLRDALNAVSQKLAKERAERAAMGAGEEEAENEKKMVQHADKERQQLEQQDSEKMDAGEQALTYTVQFIDGSIRRVNAFPSDTVARMVFRIALLSGITQWRLFHLAQLVDEAGVVFPVHRYLCSTMSLLNEGVRPHTALLFACKHYKRPIRWTDPVTQEWIFRQLQQHILREYYPVSETVAVHLASYHLQAVFGDYNAHVALQYFEAVGLEAYLPISVSAHAYEYWQERLAAIHKRHVGMMATEARSRYIDVVRTTPWWGMTFFDVQDRDNRPFIAAVAEDGLFILSATKHECLDSLTFPEIASWERCSAGVLVRRRGSHKMTLYATTHLQAKEIVDLLNEYYLLLPQYVRDELQIQIDSEETVRTRLEDPKLFEFPVVRNPFTALHNSRVACLKAAYMSSCTIVDGPGTPRVPAVGMLRSMDRAADEDMVLETLDFAMADPPLDDQHLAAFIEVFGCVMRKGEPLNTNSDWKENIGVTALLLAQPSASQQLITASAVPNIAMLISLLPSLQTLDLSYIPLDTGADQICSSLVSSTIHLQRLVLKGCRIGARAIQSILSVLTSQHPSTLQHLDLEKNFLTHAAIHPLCLVLGEKRCMSLSELILAYNCLESLGIDALISTARTTQQLRLLDVSGNPGLRPPSRCAVHVVSKGTGISRLSLRSCDMHLSLFQSLENELLLNEDILSLDISMNRIGDAMETHKMKNIFCFLAASSSTTRIEELHMNDCGLVEGILGNAFGTALLENRTLRHISLRANRLAYHTGFLSPLIVDAVGSHSALCVLNLSGNCISYAGCMRLCSSLARSMTLRELYLDANELGGDASGGNSTSYGELVALLECSASLEILSFCHTGLDDGALERLGEGLSHNTVLHKFLASGNAFTPIGITGFARLIHRNESLRTLDLSSDSVREDETVYADTLRLLTSAGRLDSVLL